MKVQVIYTINKEVEIIMPRELQSKEFADEYLAIQNLDTRTFEKVRVLFENTLWIDNLPIMQLFLYIRELKMLGKKIAFMFNVDAEVTEQVRFIKYMEDYGFIKIIEELADDFDNTILAKAYSGKGYKNLIYGDFKSSECFMPFQIISKKEEIAKYIADTTENFNDKFINLYSDYDKDNLIFRMSVFLQEAIGNVFEHAFENPEDAFCGVMIRYIHKNRESKKYLPNRQYLGVQKDRTVSRPFQNATFTIIQHQQLAVNHNPYRNGTGMKVLENYIQIFVTDIGMGLLKSMGLSDAKMERGLINEIFEKGARSDKNKNTIVGGLGSLYQLLRKKENYISIKAEYNWARIACAVKIDKKDTLPYVHKTGILSDNVLKGFTVVGYIDCDDERKKDFFMPVPRETIENIYQEEYILSDMGNIQDTNVIDFRFGIPDLANIKIQGDTVLCLVGQNIEKALWCNKIPKLLEHKDSNKTTLILADIPEREMRKYELIFEEFDINVTRAVLLTNSLKLAVFERKKGGLFFSKLATEHYQKTRNQGVDKSLYCLLRAIRKYDSQLFWQTVYIVQKTKEAKLFVKGKVDWDSERKNPMDSYLDFSQACFDEKIKNILLNQLYRVPNCGEYDNYFISMDRFTEDLCENVNGKLKVPLGEKDNMHICLGSVYVTGTSSKKSKIDVKGREEREYYCFMHPLIDFCDGSRIKALLMWPSKEIIETLFGEFGDVDTLKRLAKTPFLAPSGATYFSQQHYKDIKESIGLKVDELYSVLQEEPLWTSRLIKIAHIDMLSYDDYVYLNARAIFNKHYMESRYCMKYTERNSFDYLLKQMYIALGKSKRKSFQKAIEVDIQPAHAKIVCGKMNQVDIPYEQGLFVYLTDYETMEIISKFKEIFSEEMQKRIIPIAPISKKRGSSALLLSPILMENIKEKLQKISQNNPEQETRVTIFMATVTSTTLQRELKHILYRLGAKKIKCISLVDRQRFPLGSREKESYNSFCKVDLPHLGSEDKCKLCIGINKLNDLKNRLLSTELQKRCAQIVTVWGKVKASDNLHEKGVRVQHVKLSQELEQEVSNICKEYQIERIVLNTDVGIVLFAIEHTAITMCIDFLMKCLEDKKLSDNVKILLITAHLVLFSGEEIVPADKYYLVRYLYELLQCQNDSNAYTGLACIIILAQNEKVKELLHKHYKEHWKYEHFNNVDFIIASVGLTIARRKEERDCMLDYWVKKSEEVSFDYMYGICLFTDGNRKTRHRTMLARAGESGWKMSRMDFLSANNDAAFLDMAYRYLPYSYFEKPNECQEKKDILLEKIKNVNVMLEKAIKTDLTSEERQELSGKVNDMFLYASNFNAEIFMNTDETYRLKLSNKLQELVEKNKIENTDKNITCHINYIQYQQEYGRKFFCYTEDLQREISYLLYDFRYADKENLIQADNQESYHGIVEVIFEKDYMRYCFKNHVREDFDFMSVKKVKELKYNRPTIVSLQMMWSQSSGGHLFDYSYDGSHKIFTVELRIPYFNV